MKNRRRRSVANESTIFRARNDIVIRVLCGQDNLVAVTSFRGIRRGEGGEDEEEAAG